MADIYAFPLGTPTAARADNRENHAADIPMNRPLGVPDVVWNAVLSVRNMRRVNGVAYREIPIPCAMADFGVGVALESSSYRDEKSYFRNDLRHDREPLRDSGRLDHGAVFARLP